MALGWRQSYLRYREFFLNIVALYKKRPDLKAFLEIILSISTITIFLLFALKPTILTIISLYQQIQDKKTTLAGLTQKVSNLATANGVLTRNQSVIPDINFAVPKLPNPDALSQQIEALAVRDSVSILGLSVNQVALVGTLSSKTAPGLKALPGNAKEMTFSLNVSGDYTNLMPFVRDFENLRLTSKIDTLSISSSTTEKGTVIILIISGRIPYIGS